MTSNDGLGEERTAFEARLGRLAPAAVGGGRDALMFEAGRQSAARGRRRWQVLAAAAVCVAAAVAVQSALWPVERVVERVVTVRPDAPAPAAPADRPAGTPPVAPAAVPPAHAAAQPVSEFAYIRIRQQVLAHGLDALPSPPTEPARPQDPRRLRDALLGGNRRSG